MAEKLSKLNQSVQKVLQIIEIMSKEPEPIRLQDIALKAEMPTSTALRMINTLLVNGYVNQDAETLRYFLSLKFTQIGCAVSSHFSLQRIAHPMLLELRNRCQESCCLGVEENHELTYIDVVDGPDSMLRIMQRIGKRAPLHSTGIGKLLLLNYSEKQLGELISVKGLSPLTPNTLVTRNSLEEHLKQVRAQGYAVDDEECVLGARCVAAPVRDYTGKVIAGISISGPTSRLTKERISVVAPVVKDIADKISKALAYPG